MPDTTTTNYAFTLPEVGAPSPPATPWGPKLNDNFTSIDTLIKAINDSLGAAGDLPLTSLIPELNGMTIKEAVEYILALSGGAGIIPAANVSFDNTDTELAAVTAQAALEELDLRALIYDEETFTATVAGSQVFTLTKAADAISYILVGGTPQPAILYTLTWPAVTLLQPSIAIGMEINIGLIQGT